MAAHHMAAVTAFVKDEGTSPPVPEPATEQDCLLRLRVSRFAHWEFYQYPNKARPKGDAEERKGNEERKRCCWIAFPAIPKG